jgi:pyridoxamine 5'-phosphate oxidase
MDFQAIRKEYESAGLDESKLLDDPMDQFRNWFELAGARSPGKWFEVNAMTLATSDLSGNVSSRIVLLKGVRDEGFVFYTNYQSAKGNQLSENPRASLTFHWPYLGRQVRVIGAVSKTSREDSEAYFHSRPRGSQFGALASAQSKTIESREALEQQRESLIQQVGDEEVPCPNHWGGYLVTPGSVEFWQGRLDRLHDRIVYRQDGEAWARSRISP